jgi:hypothetical protein
MEIVSLIPIQQDQHLRAANVGLQKATPVTARGKMTLVEFDETLAYSTGSDLYMPYAKDIVGDVQFYHSTSDSDGHWSVTRSSWWLWY